MPRQSGSSKSTQLLHLLMWGEGTGLKISVSPLPSKSLALPNDCSIQSKGQRPCRLKNVFNSSHIIQEEIPVGFAVKLERLTKLGPFWPFYQMSSELVSSLSSSLPQTASFSGVSGEFGRRPSWTKKWECLRAEILPKFLVVRNMSSIEWFWKRSQKGSTLKAFVDWSVQASKPKMGWEPLWKEPCAGTGHTVGQVSGD